MAAKYLVPYTDIANAHLISLKSLILLNVKN